MWSLCTKFGKDEIVAHCYILEIELKMNNNRYGVNIISLIPSPLVGEG